MTELDETLSGLFAEAREALPADEFERKLAIRLSQARRRRTMKQVVLSAAVAGIAIAATPYVVTASLAGASNLGLWACSLAVAAWTLRRAGRTS